MSDQIRVLPVVVRIQAAARGVTLRGAVGYLLTWTVVVLAAGMSISTLGLRLAPPGSSALDMASILLLILPASVLTRSLRIRVPEFDSTRSRPRQPSTAMWAAGIGTVAVVSPMIVGWMLHPALSTAVFRSDWYMVVGLCLLLGTLWPVAVSTVVTFAVVAVFSIPGVVPWEANLFYNLDLTWLSTPLGVAMLTIAVIAAAAKPGAASRN